MANQDLTIPVITIDGGAGTGKGAVRSIVARELGFHQLDSGALYRSVALISIEKNITKVSELVSVADNLIFQMKNNKALLRGRDVTTLIRSNQVADRASEISKIKEVRQALLKHELSAHLPPGLVADGRDMGEIFSTPYKFFLVATPEVRARRRVLQFQKLGHPSNYQDILKEILDRDEVDRTRDHSPFVAHSSAKVIDVNNISAQEVANIILTAYKSG